MKYTKFRTIITRVNLWPSYNNCHDITEILLKVALNTINLNPSYNKLMICYTNNYDPYLGWSSSGTIFLYKRRSPGYSFWPAPFLFWFFAIFPFTFLTRFVIFYYKFHIFFIISFFFMIRS